MTTVITGYGPDDDVEGGAESLQIITCDLGRRGIDDDTAARIRGGDGDVLFDLDAVIGMIGRLRAGVIQAGSETQSGWGRRLEAMMAVLTIDFGDADDLERSLRRHYRAVFDGEITSGSRTTEKVPGASDGMTAGRMQQAEVASRYADLPRHVIERAGLPTGACFHDLTPEGRMKAETMVEAMVEDMCRWS